MTTSQLFFVTCPKGFEDLLKQELEKLDISEAEIEHSGVSFSGNIEQAYKVCLWSRLASRVLMKIKSFPAEEEEALYEGIKSIDWSQHLDVDGTLAINCTLNQSNITNSHYASLKSKDAIVDQFTERFDERPSIDKDLPDVRINVFINNDEAEVSIDLSGLPLHKRGYRLSAAKAPLKENLAAAILTRCGWAADESAPLDLLDPMCGSATFLIEAVQMSLNIAPGLKRKYYGFTHWNGHQPDIWSKLIAEAKQQIKPASSLSNSFTGYDADKFSIATARQNVHSAGFQDIISLEQMEFSESCERMKTDAESIRAGMVVVNPPYGERLGEKRELAHLYSEMGECWREFFPDWKIALFTANDDLLSNIGLRAHRTNSFFNGAIKCKLNQYQIRPALTTEQKEQRDHKYTEQRTAILNRLKKNFKHLKKWASKNKIEAYRVYDADIPEYSAAIDLYNDWALVQEYQAPSTIELNKARQRFDLLVDVIPEALGIKKEKLIVKTRRQQKGLAQYEKQGSEQHVLFVEEHGLKFIVNLTDYLDTGLFLDHRLTRKFIYDQIESVSGPVTFLNLFSYTSSVSVYAAAAGASTTSVDMSNTYIDWSKRNFKNNDLLSDEHEFIKADCTKWLVRQREEGKNYDIIFIDPPTFSNSKSMDNVFDVQKDHEDLIFSAMRLLADGGQIIFSNNFKRFKLAPIISEKFDVENVTALTIPEDFKRNKRIHHCFVIKAKNKS